MSMNESQKYQTPIAAFKTDIDLSRMNKSSIRPC